MRSEGKLRLFIYARILVSFLFLVSTLLWRFQDPSSVDYQFHSGIVRLMIYSFCFSLVSLVFIRFSRFHLFLTYLQTIWDLLFVTVLLLFTGGVTSPYSFLYLLSIMNAGVLLGRREAVYTASLCAILYGAMVDFQYFGILAPLGLSQSDAVNLGNSRIFYTIFINLIGFSLTAVITGYISGRARETELALRKKSIDYEELAQLHTTIVSNIDVGIVTTDMNEAIGVFNPYMESLTGVLQADVYGTNLGEIFPKLPTITASGTEVQAGEFQFARADEQYLTIGFSAAPFYNSQGDKIGIILSLRDLTSVRQMERALKRADRMAALGELSARMAHEIRNPLASMSGSVQLLSEQGSGDESDKRLLSIVVREAGRLNGLITDFLEYARPPSPVKERIILRDMIEEMRLLLSADIRFQCIDIQNHIPEYMIIRADAHQLKQVLFNLLNNSADAMSGDGRIEIESSFILSGADAFMKSPVAVLTIADNGPGVSEDSISHIFEPFYTTKTDGTGLGLAICYRIIEAHGGTILVESLQTGGCRFTIMLPV